MTQIIRSFNNRCIVSDHASRLSWSLPRRYTHKVRRPRLPLRLRRHKGRVLHEIRVAKGPDRAVPLTSRKKSLEYIYTQCRTNYVKRQRRRGEYMYIYICRKQRIYVYTRIYIYVYIARSASNAASCIPAAVDAVKQDVYPHNARFKMSRNARFYTR